MWRADPKHSGNAYTVHVPVVSGWLLAPLYLALDKTPLREIPFKQMSDVQRLLVRWTLYVIHSALWGFVTGFVVARLSLRFSQPLSAGAASGG
jgi:hypothetical protein